MARRKPFKGFKDPTFLNFKNFDYGRSAAMTHAGWSPMPSRLLERVENAVKRLMLSELPPEQREALQDEVCKAVSVVDFATEHQKDVPAQRVKFEDKAKKLRLVSNILNEEREQLHKLQATRDLQTTLRKRQNDPSDPLYISPEIIPDGFEYRWFPETALAVTSNISISGRSVVDDAIAEVERLAALYEQSAASASERRSRAEYLATLHAWGLLINVRECFWAREGVNGCFTSERSYWRPWRIKRLPGLQRGGDWHELASDLYGDKVNFEYLQNLYVPMREGGRSKQSFWEKKKKNSGTMA